MKKRFGYKRNVYEDCDSYQEMQEILQNQSEISSIKIEVLTENQNK